MRHVVFCPFLLLLALLSAASAQVIRSSYIDLTVPGQWVSADDLGGCPFGSEVFYDSASGAIVQISAQANMQRVTEISKLFQSVGASGTPDVSQLFSAVAFPLPRSYVNRASVNLNKGEKPPRLWDLKEGEGNAVWFYASQLFDEYHQRNRGGASSEVTEQFYPSRVLRAENRTIPGGETLVLEAETERSPNEAALKRFKMPSALKEQKVRYGWIQFAPGGIAAGQGVLSISFAAPANSDLHSESVLNQIASGKLKPM